MTLNLELGDELYAEIGPNCDRAQEWAVVSSVAPKGWTGKLISRASRLYEQGDAEWFWVYRINSRDQRYWVSDSNFGRMPISDRLRPTYIRAARALSEVVEDRFQCDEALLENLSQMKGILNRCRKKDQWDWLTLYQYLERPASGLLEYGASTLYDLRRSVRRNELESIRQLQCRLEGSFPAGFIQRFIARLQESAPRLRQVIKTPTTVPGEQVVTTSPEPMDFESKIKLERANEAHSAAVWHLSAALESQGYVVEQNRLIDVFCRLKSGPAIFEVKSITPSNERTQCRHALSQLYEYRYLHDLEQASLWIVLSGQPAARWIVDYLMSDRDINVLWLEGGKISGPSVDRLDLDSIGPPQKRI